MGDPPETAEHDKGLESGEAESHVLAPRGDNLAGSAYDGPRRATAVLVNQNHEVPAGGVPPFTPTHWFQLDTPPSLAENGRAREWSWGVRGDSPQTAPRV